MGFGLGDYRHAAHAGNFADAFKHALLALLLAQQGRSPEPLCYVDVHAGAGRYALRRRVLCLTCVTEHAAVRVALKPLCRALRAANWPQPSVIDAPLRYPGSPLLAAALLRSTDRLVLAERRRPEANSLRRLFRGDRRVRVYGGDGLLLLQRLRPSERRGVVFLDPPFESAAEVRQAVRGLRLAARLGRRFTGVLWYPIRADGTRDALLRALSARALRGALMLELRLAGHATGNGLAGCGMLFMHPPRRFAAAATALLPHLASALAGRTAVARLSS
jgi:23S rRNA (adenine2030-N6)-methyltransferase